MKDDRAEVMNAVRDALRPLPERAGYPDWEDALAISLEARFETNDLWQPFASKLKGVNGTPLRGLEQLGTYLRDAGFRRGYCDPDWLGRVRAIESFKDMELETSLDRSRIDEYEFGITRAEGAIAETGTIVLTDRCSSSRLAALAPWTHAALIPADKLWPDTVIAMRELPYDPSTVWVTGPSKTADVEGILIEGVHGPGVQIGCLVEV